MPLVNSQFPTSNSQDISLPPGYVRGWALGVEEFIGMGSHRRRVVTDIRPCSSVRRSDLQTPLRRVSRAPRRWQNPRRRHAAEHAESAHPAHARLRRDDDDRVSVESRRSAMPSRVSSANRAAIRSRGRKRSAAIVLSRSTRVRHRSGTAGVRRRDNSRFSPAALAQLTPSRFRS